MSANAPVVIEAALNGVTSKRRNPHVPITAEEHAGDGIACIDAGATVIHTHTEHMAAPVEEVAEEYARAYRPIVAAHPGAICYATTGIGPTIEDRYRHVELLADIGGVTRAAFVDTGTVNLGGTGPDGLPAGPGYVYKNDFADVAHKMNVCRERGLGPSIAVFEPGFLRVVLAYAKAGALPRGTLVKLYFSEGGYLGGGEPLWGLPPTRESLDAYLAMMGDTPLAWAVAVLGGSLLDAPIARLALERGGHLRVGLEDWDDGPANTEQVARATKLCADVGRPVATIDDAAQILDLPEPE
jgi:uncharacterized protein (DUF849 family)